MAGSLALSTTGLRKSYGDLVAVRGLTLEVRRGEVFGFLGPNGAGKTTSIKMMLGLVRPSAGAGTLLGAPLGGRAARAAREKVGFLPEHFRFHDWLTAAEFLALHGRLYGMDEAAIRRRAPELLERVGLAAFRDKFLRGFSKGMLQRVGLAQALLNDPDIVFLDEPTSGLDPVGRILVRDLIRELRARGTAVFLNSHLLSEVEATCDRVAFIRHGEVVRMEGVSALLASGRRVNLRARGIGAEVRQRIEKRGWSLTVQEDGDGTNAILEVGSADDVPELNRLLVEAGVDVLALNPERTTLEELFLQILGTEGGL